MNEALPPGRKDQIGWIVSRIDDPSRAAQIAQAVDKHFEERDIQTLSMSERALNTSFLGMISAVLKAVNIVSLVILLIMVLILGNTIAMGVRERTNEYGVLRAIGFKPKHLAGFVVGEALAIGALGGAVGLAVGYPFVEKGLGRWLEENMGAFFPFFRVDPKTAGVAFALAIGLGLLSSAIPAYQAARLNVLDALRRVG
jgi:putative ABC transport system permease protein